MIDLLGYPSLAYQWKVGTETALTLFCRVGDLLLVTIHHVLAKGPYQVSGFLFEP